MSEKNEPQRPFNPTQEQDERFKTHYNYLTDYRDRRNKQIDFFYKGDEERNIMDYVEDSVNRMNEKHLKPEYKEEWQNNVFDPVTRNKVIAILSKLAATRMKPELIVKPNSIFNNKDTKAKRMVFSDLLEAANNHNKDEQQLIWEMYTALSEGTVFGFESWKKDARTVEYVVEYNPDTGEKKTETMTVNAWDDVYGQIVPINEFYPETIWVNEMSKLHTCFWRRIMNKAEFNALYKNFGNHSKVNTAGHWRGEDNFDWGISADVDDNHIEVLQWYDSLNDKMGIWANGVELYWGCMPWNHKRLPFWRAIGEPIHHQFLYGKSLPDKLMGMQDLDNGLFNAMLDQLFLSLNSPTVIAGHIDDLDDGYLEPGRYYEASPDTKVERVKTGTVDGSVFPTLQLIKRSEEESSISSQATGVPTGGRKTKFEVQALQEGAMNLAGLFLQLFENAQADKYWLRMHNILQYYSMPSKDKEGNPKFKFITLEGAELPNGKVGKKMIQIVGTNTDKPGNAVLRDIAEKEEGREFNAAESTVQPIVITREWLKTDGLDLEMKIVPNSSVKDSSVTKSNKDVAFYQMANGDPGFNQELIRKDVARAFDKPAEVVVTAEERQAEEQRQQQQAQAQQQQKGVAGGPGRVGAQAGGQGQFAPDLI